MATGFLHGVEVVEVDDGPRSLRAVQSAVIGIVGTAPDADEQAFPPQHTGFGSGLSFTSRKTR